MVRWREYLLAVALLATLLAPTGASAKGDGRALYLVGTISDLGSTDQSVSFALTGGLLVEHCEHNRCSTELWPSSSPIRVELRQEEPFFAMSPGWSGGALRQPSTLHGLLERSVRSGSELKFELTEPQITFRRWGDPARVVSAVHRVTDPDLK